MNYKQLSPPEDLRPYIRYFGLMENDDSTDQAKTFRIIADGCPGLIFQENPNCFLDKNKNKLPQIFLHGVTTRHSEKTAKGRYRNIGVYFQPHALKSIFGIDASELKNHYADIDAILKSDLTLRLLRETSMEGRIEILSNFLRYHIDKNKQSKNVKMPFILARMMGGKGKTALREVQSELNISERLLERIFKINVGVSPKLFLRINRFQNALDQIRKQKLQSFSDAVCQCDYADQSHYIREFKEFSGVNPKQFLRRANEQVMNFPEWKS